MSRKRNMPNLENCTLEELRVAAKASKIQRTYIRRTASDSLRGSGLPNLPEHSNQDIEFKRPRNILVMDNASWHKSKSLKWGRFEPLSLPLYSPDLNPMERLWLILEAPWFCGFYAQYIDELIDRLTIGLRWLRDRKHENIKRCSTPTEIYRTAIIRETLLLEREISEGLEKLLKEIE